MSSIITVIVAALSAYGLAWAVGRAIVDPNLWTTIGAVIGLAAGNLFAILKVKGRLF